MSFNPLGTFNPVGPLNDGALTAAVEYVKLLKSTYPCPPGSLTRIYKHWTVGHYDQDFNDYNGAVRYDGQHFHLDVCGNPQDNAVGVNNNEPHSHTYMRNTGAFGVSTDDMVFASPENFGPEPITLLAAEYLCAAVGAIAAAYEIDLGSIVEHGPYDGEEPSFTHAEAANHPGHPEQYANYYVTGERWDWATMTPFPSGVHFPDLDPGILGAALRKRERLYKIAILQDMK